MTIKRVIFSVFLSCACAGLVHAQDAPAVPAASASTSDPALARRPAEKPAVNETISLTVPKGTPLQVALDEEVRVGKVGQPVRGRVVEPVYAFDKVVIPVGTEVTGKITKIESVSGGKRTAAALDADFTPSHKVEVEFNNIKLPDGREIAVQTIVTPGSGQVIEFVSAADRSAGKGGQPNAAEEKAAAARRAAKQEWANAIKQVQEPGKMHRLGHYAVAQLPVHPQYIDAGTVYSAELQDSLDFGTEPLTPQLAASIGTTPPDGSVVAARLVTPLNSATSHQGDAVEAVISRPVFDGDRLLLPEGSKLQGSVIQVQPARHPGRNGELRIVFHELRLADGLQQKMNQKVEASLAGVEAAKVDNVKLDSEGGAKAAAPATRFLTTGAEVGLGVASFLGDSFGETGPRAAGGAGGYKLIGIALGLAVHSQPFGMAMGAFGGTRAIYANFIARGHDVVFPKNTAMAIGIATRQPTVTAPPTPPVAQQ
ncbi:MAG TPA: hypothetical protein VN822_00325 [Candidatus Acidoferrales bacterium]|nr:hypothetical protein [Candidatus Acidoferrales bacterium]